MRRADAPMKRFPYCPVFHNGPIALKAGRKWLAVLSAVSLVTLGGCRKQEAVEVPPPTEEVLVKERDRLKSSIGGMKAELSQLEYEIARGQDDLKEKQEQLASMAEAVKKFHEHKLVSKLWEESMKDGGDESDGTLAARLRWLSKETSRLNQENEEMKARLGE